MPLSRIVLSKVRFVERLSCLVLLVQSCETGGTRRELFGGTDSVRTGVAQCEAKLDDSYRVAFRASPSYFRDDFDGDFQEDFALQVERVLGSRVTMGIAFCLSSTGWRLSIVGAGNDIRYFDDSYELEAERISDLVFDFWRVQSRETVEDSFDCYRGKMAKYRERLPKFRGEVLEVTGGKRRERYDLYWDGQQFRLLPSYKED